MKKLSLSVLTIFILSCFYANSSEKSDFALAKNLDIFNSIVKELNIYYVDSIPVEDMIEAGINGMLNKLDPYTTYIPESETNDFKFMTTGEYGGIGSVISTHEDGIRIIEIYENTPAYKAGLKAGDIILEVDGKITKGKSVGDVSAMLKGIPDTKVSIKVKRPHLKKLLSFEITREKIYLNPVVYHGKYGNVGYIRLSNFTEDCSSEVKKALLELKEQGITSLIIDLRNNPGGILSEAVNICNFFVPKGEEIVSTKGKLKQLDKSYKTSFNPIELDMPLAILVNENSASAAEIVAGALQDLDRAVIIGNRTFGKGLVQSTYPLDYNGNLKVTIAKYYTPSGRCIQAINYNSKNESKKSEEIPDSLTTEFKTKKGRMVRDGRGISPDIKTDVVSSSTISYYLLTKNIIFDYVTEYCSKHEKIASITDFVFTDNDYDEFKKFVLEKNFTYDLQTQKSLEKLIETAKKENYYADNEAEFKALEAKLAHNTSKDLDNFKEEIKEFISVEIAKRYYFQRGEMMEMLKKDNELNTAIELLKNKEKYNQIFIQKNK